MVPKLPSKLSWRGDRPRPRASSLSRSNSLTAENALIDSEIVSSGTLLLPFHGGDGMHSGGDGARRWLRSMAKDWSLAVTNEVGVALSGVFARSAWNDPPDCQEAVSPPKTAEGEITIFGVRGVAPVAGILPSALGIEDRPLDVCEGVVPEGELNAPKHIGRLLRFFFFSFNVESA